MSTLDWTICIVYLLSVFFLGLYVSKRNQSLKEYFLAGRKLGIWSVALSVIATETSAATVIGGPDTAFRGNCAYLQTSLGTFLSRIVLAYLFLDVYYRHDVLTVYSFLDKRYGRAVRVASAGLFCFARLLASGARLYIAAFAVSSIASLGLLQALLLVGLIALVYGTLGGLRAVVATDVLQGLLFLAVGVVSLSYIVMLAGGFDTVHAVASATGKLTLFDFRDFDVFSASFWQNPYTLPGALFGGFFLGLATHGTDQDMVQRLLACRNSKAARRSMLLTAIIELPVAALYVLIGVSLWVLFKETQYHGPGVHESAFPYFIEHFVPSGLRGLMLAAVLAAAMSSLDSAITALSSVAVVDLVGPFRKRSSHVDEDEHMPLFEARGFSVFSGLLLITSAYLIGIYHQGLQQALGGGEDRLRQTELLTLALGVMSVLYGPLLGVFLAAIFSKRGSQLSALLALFLGILVTACLWTGYLLVIGWTWHVVIGCNVSFFCCIMVKPQDKRQISR
jgi:SSS family transporter